MQGFVTQVAAARRRWLVAAALAAGVLLQGPAGAQSASYAQGEMVWNQSCANACHSLASRQAIFATLTQTQARGRLDTAIASSATGMMAFSGMSGVDRDSLVIFIGNFIPVASVAPGLTINMTSTAVGTPSAATTITVTNTGRIAMTIGANIAKTGSHPNDFAVAGVGNGCAAQTVAVGANCRLMVVFTPAAAGARDAQLTLTHNGDPATTVIQLNGTTGSGGGGSPPPAGGDGGGGAFHPLLLLALLLPAWRRRRFR
jgi:hypothetical protein